MVVNIIVSIYLVPLCLCSRPLTCKFGLVGIPRINVFIIPFDRLVYLDDQFARFCFLWKLNRGVFLAEIKVIICKSVISDVNEV